MIEICAEFTEIIKQLNSHTIPESYPQATDDSMPSLKKILETGIADLSLSGTIVRDEIIKLSGFALVAYNWIRPLAEWIGTRSCLEVMSGSGVLAKALQDCGISVIATDDYSWSKREWQQSSWTEVEQLDCLDAIEKYGRDTDILICSWPPYDNDISYRLLQKMRAVNPNMIMLYIGEWGGATGCKQFFDNAVYIEDDAFEKAVGNYTQIHFAIHDRPFLLH